MNHTVKCEKCGHDFSVLSHDVINVGEHPELKDQVLNGSLFISECPYCGSRRLSVRQLVYLDPKEMFLCILSQDKLSLEDTQGYTSRLVDKCGDLIEKVKIMDAGLDDVAIEMCKFVTRQELGKDVALKFLKMEGADNELVFTYPSKGEMEMLAIGFNVYEDCRGIISRNPVMEQKAKGLVKIDETWISSFFK